VLEGVITGDDNLSAEIHYDQVRTTPAGLVVLVEELAQSSGGAA
jgi:hypothetical protein